MSRSGAFDSSQQAIMSVIFLLVFLPASMCYAEIEIRIPDGYPSKSQFANNVNGLLTSLESANNDLRRLVDQARRSPARILISPVTDDRATWHEEGDRTRSHTEPSDGRPKNLGRNTPTDCIIYVNPRRIDPLNRSFEEGTLVHELVHALDLAYGRYHARYEIRERRAVFMQNYWKDLSGYRLRDSYHGRFPTLDYQNAKSKRTISDYVEHILTRPDLPEH